MRVLRLQAGLVIIRGAPLPVCLRAPLLQGFPRIEGGSLPYSLSSSLSWSPRTISFRLLHIPGSAPCPLLWLSPLLGLQSCYFHQLLQFLICFLFRRLIHLQIVFFFFFIIFFCFVFEPLLPFLFFFLFSFSWSLLQLLIRPLPSSSLLLRLLLPPLQQSLP